MGHHTANCYNSYGTLIVAIFNNLIYIQFGIYIYVFLFLFFQLISIFISYFLNPFNLIFLIGLYPFNLIPKNSFNSIR